MMTVDGLLSIIKTHYRAICEKHIPMRVTFKEDGQGDVEMRFDNERALRPFKFRRVKSFEIHDGTYDIVVYLESIEDDDLGEDDDIPAEEYAGESSVISGGITIIQKIQHGQAVECSMCGKWYELTKYTHKCPNCGAFGYYKYVGNELRFFRHDCVNKDNEQ